MQQGLTMILKGISRRVRNFMRLQILYIYQAKLLKSTSKWGSWHKELEAGIGLLNPCVASCEANIDGRDLLATYNIFCPWLEIPANGVACGCPGTGSACSLAATNAGASCDEGKLAMSESWPVSSCTRALNWEALVMTLTGLVMCTTLRSRRGLFFLIVSCLDSFLLLSAAIFDCWMLKSCSLRSVTNL